MVSFDNVSVSFGKKTPIRELSFVLPERGVAAVSGASGSGKTTLLRLIAGLIKPTEGNIRGLDDKRVSYVFQEDRLLSWLTASENVSLVSDENTAHRILDDMELTDSLALRPDKLSGGMNRRVSIARALAFGGDILLLDEPFKGLDARLTEKVAQRIKNAFPLTVIATHNLDEARLLDDKSVQIRL